METSNDNFQIQISQFLLNLGESVERTWFNTGIFFLIFLIFLAVRQHPLIYNPTQVKSHFISRFLRSSVFFSIIIGLSILILRLPGSSRLECNFDESQWISAANTLLIDPRFWLSVDGSTSGPLVIFPLTLISIFGGTINYGTVKLVGTIIWVFSSLLVFRAFVNFFNDHIARVLILPLVACVSTITYWDYVAYNSEHIPILLTSLGIFLYSKIENSSSRQQLLFSFLLALVLGLMPYSKLQAVPVALVIAMFLMGQTDKKSMLYVIIGGLLPTVLVMSYLLSLGIIEDFWQSFILNNLIYASKGASAHNSLFVERIQLFPKLALESPDTRFYFISQIVLIILSTYALIRFSKKYPYKSYKLISLAFLVALATIYAIIQPGNPFPHYILLLIVPVTFLSGSLIGTIYRSFPAAPLLKSVSVIVAILLFSSTVLPVSKYNPALPEASGNVYNGINRSAVARKIAELAQPGERMALWGWANKYHAETGLALGTRDLSPIYQIIDNPLQSYFQRRYITDLVANKPLLFADAVAPNQFYFTDRSKHSYENFPAVRSFIDSLYHYVTEVEGVRIFMRKSSVQKTYRLPSGKTTINYTIDKIMEDSIAITVSGWAYLEGQNTNSIQTKLIMQCDGNIYVIEPFTMRRSDVTQFFKSYNLDHSGFSAHIPKLKLKPSEYKLGIYVLDKKNKKQGFVFTNQIISIN